jgi:hypothetical protein
MALESTHLRDHNETPRLCIISAEFEQVDSPAHAGPPPTPIFSKRTKAFLAKLDAAKPDAVKAEIANLAMLRRPPAAVLKSTAVVATSGGIDGSDAANKQRQHTTPIGAATYQRTHTTTSAAEEQRQHTTAAAATYQRRHDELRAIVSGLVASRRLGIVEAVFLDMKPTPSRADTPGEVKTSAATAPPPGVPPPGPGGLPPKPPTASKTPHPAYFPSPGSETVFGELIDLKEGSKAMWGDSSLPDDSSLPLPAVDQLEVGMELAMPEGAEEEVAVPRPTTNLEMESRDPTTRNPEMESKDPTMTNPEMESKDPTMTNPEMKSKDPAAATTTDNHLPAATTSVEVPSSTAADDTIPPPPPPRHPPLGAAAAPTKGFASHWLEMMNRRPLNGRGQRVRPASS